MLAYFDVLGLNVAVPSAWHGGRNASCALYPALQSDSNCARRPTWYNDPAGPEGAAAGATPGAEGGTTEGWGKRSTSMEMWTSAQPCRGFARRDAASILLEGTISLKKLEQIRVVC